MTKRHQPTSHAPVDNASGGVPPDDADPALAVTSEVPLGDDPAERATEPGPRSSASQPPADPLGEARAEAARMRDQFLRTAADFDNFRKRTRRDLEDARKGGREDLLKELLPIFDNLERAIQSSQRAPDVKAVADGLAMILKQFNDTLARVGIARVPTTGSAFDPQVHEAIQQVE